MTTFTWKVFVISVLPAIGEIYDVVHRVQFVVRADDSTLGIRDELITIPFEYVDGQEFVPYNELTEEMVLSWLGPRKDAFERVILERLNKPELPPVEKPLPWVAPEMPFIIPVDTLHS